MLELYTNKWRGVPPAAFESGSNPAGHRIVLAYSAPTPPQFSLQYQMSLEPRLGCKCGISWDRQLSTRVSGRNH